MDYAKVASSSHQQVLSDNDPTISMSFLQDSVNNQPLTSNNAQTVIPPAGEASNKNITNETYFPRRKNAIILDNIQEISQDLCLRAVADIIGGRNIHYVSRLSGGRICMYLTNETHVNHLVQEGGVQIGPMLVTCRRYVSDATKFIVSNCPPELSDEELKKRLQPYGKIVSTPTRLKISTNRKT